MSQHAALCAKADNTCVYTDSSCVDSKLGAAALVLSNPSSDLSLILHERRRHLGNEGQITVYVAELNGILVGLQILQAQSDLHSKKAIVFSDNQGVLRVFVTLLVPPDNLF